jgi:hypothetical protein
VKPDSKSQISFSIAVSFLSWKLTGIRVKKENRLNRVERKTNIKKTKLRIVGFRILFLMIPYCGAGVAQSVERLGYVLDVQG